MNINEVDIIEISKWGEKSAPTEVPLVLWPEWGDAAGPDNFLWPKWGGAAGPDDFLWPEWGDGAGAGVRLPEWDGAGAGECVAPSDKPINTNIAKMMQIVAYGADDFSAAIVLKMRAEYLCNKN